jgi:hypothetical protein
MVRGWRDGWWSGIGRSFRWRRFGGLLILIGNFLRALPIGRMGGSVPVDLARWGLVEWHLWIGDLWG